MAAFFDGFSCQVFLRRYRCPDCHSVIRLRPSGYLKRFQASVSAIRSSIVFRLENSRWPPVCFRTRQGYWLRSLYKKNLACFGLIAKDRLLDGFDYQWTKTRSVGYRRSGSGQFTTWSVIYSLRAVSGKDSLEKNATVNGLSCSRIRHGLRGARSLDG